MALEEMREALASQADPDPNVRKDLEAAREKFTAMLAETQQQLESLWTQWDAATGDTAATSDAAAQDAAKASMVDLLNRRSYIRNLVRDVNQALELA